MENQNQEIIKKVVINVSTPLLIVTGLLGVRCWSLKKQLKIEREYCENTRNIQRVLGYMEGTTDTMKVIMEKDNDKKKQTKTKEKTGMENE